MSDALFNLFQNDIRDLDPSIHNGLFSSFCSLVYRSVFFILNDHSLTEDAIQEAFIKAMKHGPKTRLDSNMKSWLRQVARNSSYDILRKNEKYRHVSDIATVVKDEENNIVHTSATLPTELIVENIIQIESLLDILYQLNLEDQTILTLRYIKDLTYKEITNETGIPERVLGKRLERAKKKLVNLFLAKWGE